MLEFNKTRHSLYNNLDYLGLNPYEQKHFCFHGSTDGDESGDTSEADSIGGLDDTLGVTDPQGNIDDPTGVTDATMGLGDFADRAGLPGVPMGPMANIDAYHEGYYDPETGKTKSDKQYAMDILNELNQKGMTQTAQNMLNARAFQGLGIPEMNALEKQGLKTFGLGYRGPFEARSPIGLTRTNYDPNSLTGAGTDQASTNKSMFAQFARDNPNLTTVEAVSQYNATSNPDQQVSISDVQSMGFDLNAPVGPQADYREAEAQRGLAQGVGLLAQTVATGTPIGALSTVMMSGSGEDYGKGVLGHMADMFQEATGVDLPEAPDLGIPSFAEIASGVFGPEEDTMDPASFDITGVTEESIGSEAFGFADLSTPTDEEVGFTGPTDSYDYGFPRSREVAPPPVQKPVIKEKEEVIETPFPAFPVRDTTPPSRVSRVANIYGIDEDAAKRMLGIV
jgi:hypothetical protein